MGTTPFSNHRNHLFGAAITALAALALAASTAHAAVIYVDDDAPAGGDGMTWNTAYRFLQDALAFANVQQNGVTGIHVGQGIYKPDQDELHPNGTGNRHSVFYADFPGAISGGFAGYGANDPDAQDRAMYMTTLTGDLLGNDEGNFANTEDNSLTLVSTDVVPIDGFTIRSAQVGVDTHDRCMVSNCHFVSNGVALTINDYGGHVSHCMFDHNRGGISVNFGSVDVDHSDFMDQEYDAIGAGESGIGATSCTFVRNHASACSCFESSFFFRDCEFTDNQADHGGALECGATPSSSNGTIINCTFKNNSATKGGAIYTAGNDADLNSLTLLNCVFLNNASDTYGGAIFGIHAHLKAVNCTFVRNSATSGGAIFNSASAPLQLFNSILKGNTSVFGGHGPRTVRYCDLTGGYPGLGNIKTPALFVDIDAGNLRLMPGSMCIDAGRKSYVPARITTDIDGNPRFVDAPQAPNTGLGTRPVDMGAYEFQP